MVFVWVRFLGAHGATSGVVFIERDSFNMSVYQSDGASTRGFDVWAQKASVEALPMPDDVCPEEWTAKDWEAAFGFEMVAG